MRGRAASKHSRGAHSRLRRCACLLHGASRIYGEHGLMAEADETGKLTKAYGFHPDAQTNGLWSTNPVWQADVRNGKLKDEQTQWHYLHSDHLGTPYMATNKQGQRTWRAYSQAFGEAIVDGDSTTTVNLRFPGQYYDEETQTHYNFQRDYSPYTGRYLQADPIGLDGGVNFYGYVNNNPLGYLDPEGKIAIAPIFVAVWTGGCSWYAFQKALKTKAYPNNDDKSRHCMASCLITKCMLGLPVVPIVGIGKEIMDFFGDTGFEVDDVRANNIGWGKGYIFWSDCEEDCRDTPICIP